MYPLYKKLNEGGDFRCACLWEDKEGVISRAAFANGALHDIEISELIVFAGNTSGNAVIALYQDNQIIWTWHIWVTDYNPDGSGTTYTYDGNEFMDRNLGAASTTQSAESFGMMYQWGRKDPFPSFKHETSSGINATYDFLSNHKDIYNNTAEFAVKNNGPDLDYNLPLSIKEPMTFLTSDNDWCNGDDFPYRWALYKEGEHKMDHFKFEYDPCPDGWMAATALKDQDSPWTAGGIGDFWGDETFSKGILKANGDYMPATGYMHFKDAKYYQPWYWTSLPTIDYDKNSSGQVKGTMMRYYIRSSGTPNKGFVWTSPGEAMPVRCVKEVYFHPRYD
ncbi:MAG: hypothetical protein LUH22_19610 [Bacteroides sp.]|nr:hypothetical protein [Bacteroides sp.]